MSEQKSGKTKTEVNDKTAPRGMAPDKAHASREMTADRRNREPAENFNNSPQECGVEANSASEVIAVTSGWKGRHPCRHADAASLRRS